MKMRENDWKSLKELLIHLMGAIFGSLITFPTLWIMTLAEIPKGWMYIVIVIGLFGPFIIIENKRKFINYNEQMAERLKWENFAKMKRPGWPWNKNDPLTKEEIEQYM